MDGHCHFDALDAVVDGVASRGPSGVAAVCAKAPTFPHVLARWEEVRTACIVWQTTLQDTPNTATTRRVHDEVGVVTRRLIKETRRLVMANEAPTATFVEEVDNTLSRHTSACVNAICSDAFVDEENVHAWGFGPPVPEPQRYNARAMRAAPADGTVHTYTNDKERRVVQAYDHLIHAYDPRQVRVLNPSTRQGLQKELQKDTFSKRLGRKKCSQSYPKIFQAPGSVGGEEQPSTVKRLCFSNTNSWVPKGAVLGKMSPNQKNSRHIPKDFKNSNVP